MKQTGPALIAALLLAAPAAASQSQSAPAAEPDTTIVVTGERATGLVVDLERIARRCIACRRALAQLRANAARHAPPAARRFDPGETDPEAAGAQWGRGITALEVAADDRRRSLRSGEEANLRAARALNRAEASDGGARFTANLLALVDPIVERIRLERGAEAVYAPRDPAARGRPFPDITGAVIDALDRDHRAADLLADTPEGP
ncbi:MAG TPA: hypothetical protein VF552_02125 [Allosphingosinicella sp.]